MPLIATVLESGIESKLKLKFKSPAVKTSLRQILDGGSLGGSVSSAKSIDKALSNISIISKALSFGVSDIPGSSIPSTLIVQKTVANEWSNALADSICEWMSKEIAPIIAATVAVEVDAFVRSGDVIVTTTGVTVGAPSPHAITAQPGTGTVI